MGSEDDQKIVLSLTKSVRAFFVFLASSTSEDVLEINFLKGFILSIIVTSGKRGFSYQKEFFRIEFFNF